MPGSNSKRPRVSTRALAANGPKTFDAERNQVRVVAATEQPVEVYDWERGLVLPEVLRMDGAEIPESGQVPLLDSHNRWSVESVLGSAREWDRSMAGKFRSLECTVTYAGTPDGQAAAQKTREGHLTDYSVGYRYLESVFVPAGETMTIKGDSYTGPVLVRTRWALKELSTTPIGADDLAQARSEFQPEEGGNPVDPKLKELMLKRGLIKPETTDQEALAILGRMLESDQTALRSEAAPQGGAPAAPAQRSEPTPAPAQAPAADPAPETRAAVEAERKRGLDIRAAVTVSGLGEDVANDFIGRGLTLEQARAELFTRMERANPAFGPGRVEAGETEETKVRAAMVDGLCARAGMPVEKPAPGFEDFRGMGLVRMCEDILVRHGVRVRGMDRYGMAQRALSIRSGIIGSSTADLPSVMLDVAHRRLLKAYSQANSTYQMWTTEGLAVDFKPIYGISLSDLGELELVNENGEYMEDTLSDNRESYRVFKHGKIWGLTLEMIINDDLRAFLRLPSMFGAVARRKENTTVYSLLKGNPAMNDGKALFSADHGNIATGAGKGLITKDNLSAARTAMRLQKSMKGAELNLQPKYVLLPASQETDTDVLLRSVAMPQEGMSSGVYNPFGSRLIPVVEALLDATSSKAWYLIADPAEVETIEVSFLEGRRQPWVEETQKFGADGVFYKVRHIFGAGVMDFRGMHYNPGE